MVDTMNNDSEQGGIEQLSANDQKETREILAEIEKDSAQPSEPTSDPAKPVAEAAPVAPKPTDPAAPATDPKPGEGGEKKPDGQQPDGNKRREPKLIPAWVHERDKAASEKKLADLADQLAKAQSGIKPADGEAAKPADGVVEPADDMAKEIKAAAEKHGVSVEFAETLAGIIKKNGSVLPADAAKELEAARAQRIEREIQGEEVQFSADFDSKILPLIKAEYGADVPQATITEIKEGLKAKAYTPEYARVPYTTIYKGEDSFRDLVKPMKKGAEGGRGGFIAVADRAGDDSIDLTKPLAEDVIKTLTDEQFDTYSENMAKSERQSQK